MTEPTNEVRDFTLPMEPHRFRIGEDVFAAPAILAPIKLARIAELHKTLKIDTSSDEALKSTLTGIAQIFAIFLGGKSAERFTERLLSDGDEEAGNPPSIDLTRQAMPALYWLMEQYGLRPTQQSSPLPNVSETGVSTAGVPAEVLTGEVSEASPNS